MLYLTFFREIVNSKKTSSLQTNKNYCRYHLFFIGVITSSEINSGSLTFILKSIQLINFVLGRRKEDWGAEVSSQTEGSAESCQAGEAEGG